MKNKLKKELRWEIEVLPVQIKGRTEVVNKALVRSDDHKLLGIRSKYYHPVFNRDLEAIKKKILSTGGFNFMGYEEFKRGKRILSFFENKKNNLRICGESVKDYLIIGNSNDGSSKLFIGTSNYMERCENQFSMKIRAFERRHDHRFNIKDIRIVEILETYENGRQDLYYKMEKLQSTPASMEMVRSLGFKLLYPNFQKDLRESLNPNEEEQMSLLFLCVESEIKDLGLNLWGIFNGVTRYTSNHLNGNSGFGIVNGRGERINREAMKFLMSMT